MKIYSVTFSEPVTIGEETATNHRFYSLAPAKKAIKEHIDLYVGSSITKVWSNGDWEPCGEITLTGSNAVKMSNQNTYTY